MVVCFLAVTVSPVCLSNTIVNLWVSWFEMSGFFPAVDCFFILFSNEKIISDVVDTQSAIRVELLADVEHLFS